MFPGTDQMSTSVLIADDHEPVRQVVRACLEKAGFTVCGEAIDGYEALEKATALTPDVIVLDLRMPKMNGIEVASVLRHRLSKSKIVMLTMYDVGQAVAWASGIRAIIAKPDGVRKVVDCITGLMNDPEAVTPQLSSAVSSADARATSTTPDGVSRLVDCIVQLVSASHHAVEPH